MFLILITVHFHISVPFPRVVVFLPDTSTGWNGMFGLANTHKTSCPHAPFTPQRMKLMQVSFCDITFYEGCLLSSKTNPLHEKWQLIGNVCQCICITPLHHIVHTVRKTAQGNWAQDKQLVILQEAYKSLSDDSSSVFHSGCLSQAGPHQCSWRNLGIDLFQGPSPKP